MDLTWWATSYQQKEKKHINTKKCTKQGHLAVTTVLGAEAASIDLARHHRSSSVELEDHDPQMKNATTKTMKRRWGRHALPVGFAPLQFPKDLSYLMISKNTMDQRNHNHGSQTTYMQFKY
jgi:hypothetical protein